MKFLNLMAFLAVISTGHIFYAMESHADQLPNHAASGNMVKASCQEQREGAQLSIHGITFETTLNMAESQLCVTGIKVKNHPDIVTLDFEGLHMIFFQGKLAKATTTKTPAKDISAKNLRKLLFQRFGVPDLELNQKIRPIANYPYQLCWGRCVEAYDGSPDNFKIILKYSENPISGDETIPFMLVTIEEQSYSVEIMNYTVYKSMLERYISQ